MADWRPHQLKRNCRQHVAELLPRRGRRKSAMRLPRRGHLPMKRYFFATAALLCSACSESASGVARQCHEWGTVVSTHEAVAMSDMTLRATIRRDSAALAEVSMRPAAVRSLLRWERAEPQLFPSALASERLVCVSTGGDT